MSPGKRAVFVDVETTGLDTRNDQIIQLAVLPFTYTSEGHVLQTDECWVQLEDPGIEIPVRIATLTGLDHASVAGRQIARESVTAIVASAQLVIAHNASFDRPMLERRFQVFRDKPWACSQRDIDWTDEGYTSTRLEWLAYAHAGVYYDVHRADTDCYAGVHLLSTELHPGQTALGALLMSARQLTSRISAIGAPFETRSVLKARGYTWYSGSPTRPKAWRREVAPDRLQAELDWLRKAVFGRASMTRVRCETIDAYSRYSDRAT